MSKEQQCTLFDSDKTRLLCKRIRALLGTDGNSPNASEAAAELDALAWVGSSLDATLIRGNSVRP
jgi:hypothetical protein